MQIYLDIGDYRLCMDDGIRKVELVEDYGFIASQITIEADYKTIRNRFPEVVRATTDDRMPVSAVLTDVANGIKRFSGILDESRNKIVVYEVESENLTINGRSILADLIDEIPTNPRITDAWINEDWSKVIRDVLAGKGFVLNNIQMVGGPLAGQEAEGFMLLSIDHQLPGEIITNAVAATGYIANVTPDREFYFVKHIVPAYYVAEDFSLLEDDPENSDIYSVETQNGSITTIVVKKDLQIIDPGYDIMVSVPDNPHLSGRYFITQSRYVVMATEDDSYIEWTVARELPNLKSEAR